MRTFIADIDLTYKCNLACKGCERLCDTTFAGDDDISLNQIAKYIEMIVPRVVDDTSIRILGGEPVLHLQLFEILDLLVRDLRPYLSRPIELITNGYGKIVQDALDQIRLRYDTATYRDVHKNGHKVTGSNAFFASTKSQQILIHPTKDEYPPNLYVKKYFYSTYRALQDLPVEFQNKFRVDCCTTYNKYGYQLTPHGVFPCTQGASISKMFKLTGVALDHIPSPEEAKAQTDRLCRYCSIPYLSIPNSEAITITKTYRDILQTRGEEDFTLPVMELP